MNKFIHLMAIIGTVLLGGLLLFAVFAFLLAPKVLSRARDVKRKADLYALQSVLEMYYADHNVYPLVAGEKQIIDANSMVIQQLIEQEYLPGKIVDPVGEQNSRVRHLQYLYWQVDEQVYYLFASFERHDEINRDTLPVINNQQVADEAINYNWWLSNIDLVKDDVTEQITPTLTLEPIVTITPAISPIIKSTQSTVEPPADDQDAQLCAENLCHRITDPTANKQCIISVLARIAKLGYDQICLKK